MAVTAARVAGMAADVARAIARATILAVLLPVGALADHPGSGGPAGGAGPLAVALMWGGVAFVVGMLIVAVLARLTRREPRNDGDTP